MMWQCFVPSNLTAQTPQHNHSLDEDSLSDPPESQEEETLEFQEEYPQEEVEEAEEAEEVEEVEDFPLQCPRPKQLLTQEIS